MHGRQASDQFLGSHAANIAPVFTPSAECYAIVRHQSNVWLLEAWSGPRSGNKFVHNIQPSTRSRTQNLGLFYTRAPGLAASPTMKGPGFFLNLRAVGPGVLLIQTSGSRVSANPILMGLLDLWIPSEVCG